MISEAAKKRASELANSACGVDIWDPRDMGRGSAFGAFAQYIDEVSAVAKYIAKLNQGTDCPVLGSGRLEKFILPDEPDVLAEVCDAAWGCVPTFRGMIEGLRKELAKRGYEIREKARD